MSGELGGFSPSPSVCTEPLLQTPRGTRVETASLTLLAVTQRIGEPQLDECLPGHADAPGFAVNGAKQITWEIDIHALDLTTWTAGLPEFEMSREVFSGIVHLVQTSSGQSLSPRGSALLPLDAHGGPR